MATAEPVIALPDRASERAIITITSLGHAVCHLGELVFSGAMLVVMAEFRLEPQQAAALALLGYVLMGAGALPVGVWADRWGPARLLTIYFAAMTVASLAVAAAPNPWLLFLALTGLGLAASIYHPAGLAMISLGCKARGKAMGINGVAGSVGVALGPVLGMLAASWGAWRLAYLVVAGLALWAGIYQHLACRGLVFPGATPKRSRAGSAALAVESPNGQTGKEIQRWLPRFGPLAFLFFAMMCGGFNYRCLLTALPSFLSGESAAGAAKAILPLLLTLGVGGVGQYAGGWLADRFGGRLVYPVLVLLMVPLSAGLGFLGGTPAALGIACGLAFCVFAQQPVENTLLAESTSAGRRSTSYGIKFVLTFGIGAVGAYVTGWMWHHFNALGPVFYLIAGSAALMALLLSLFVAGNAKTAKV